MLITKPNIESFISLISWFSEDSNKQEEKRDLSSNNCSVSDAILPRKGPVTRAMSKKLQEDWARATEEGPTVLMNLKVDC